MKKYLVGLISLFVFLLPSCQPLAPEEEKPVQPEGYQELLAAHKTQLCYTKFEWKDNSINLRFEDGSKVKMDVSKILVENCTASTPKIVAFNKEGYCMIGGEATIYKYDTALDDKDAFPFYVYYEKESVHVRISNGNHIVFNYKDPALVGAIPVIYLVTNDRGDITSKEEYKEGSIEIQDPDHKYWETTNFKATMRIRGRGNSTWGMPKKPYKIKLDSKARLFDMSNDKEWCLLANYCDKSLLRNMTAMEISRRMNFSWTPKMVPVEVYLNGRYQGVYTFTEHKKVSAERVNINVDGGDCYFELESNQDEIVCWWSRLGAPLMFLDPSEPTEAQTTAAKQFFADFENELTLGKYSKVYEKYIDVDSFVEYFIIQELTKNVDGNLRKSTFLTLPAGGKLEMYHVWDFDISMGNCDYYGDGKTPWQGWWIKTQNAWGYGQGWYWLLFKDPEFVKKVKARWNELYPELKTIPEYIDMQAANLEESAGRNFQRWNILNTYVWPNYKVTGSYQGEVDWLKSCYSQRLVWMNTEINKL